MAARDLFKRAKLGLPKSTEFFDSDKPFEIPIIEDMEGNTAIDVAMGIAEGSGWKISFNKKNFNKMRGDYAKAKANK